MIYDWISLGGGAAGFFGALQFAEASSKNSKNPSILILEGSPHLLSKVKISGGGRCNVTHHCFDPNTLSYNYPRGAKELRRLFFEFQPKDTFEWFESRGLPLKIEEDNRVFPITDQSQSIIDLFLSEAKKYSIKIQTSSPVQKIISDNELVTLELKSGDSLRTRKLLLATGSNPNTWKMIENLGIKLVEPAPSLFSFNITDERLTDFAGQSFKNVRIALKNSQNHKIGEMYGPMLITHWGLSGPAILKLSAFAARHLKDSDYKGEIEISFLPQQKREQVQEKLRSWRTTEAFKKIKTLMPSCWPKEYGLRIWKKIGLEPDTLWGSVSNHHLEKMTDELTKAVFTIDGKTTYKEEFVTAGGIALDEIDFKTMALKKYPHILTAGEVIDIDGVTGGFNFQAAWTTSTVAARGAV